MPTETFKDMVLRWIEEEVWKMEIIPIAQDPQGELCRPDVNPKLARLFPEYIHLDSDN